MTLSHGDSPTYVRRSFVKGVTAIFLCEVFSCANLSFSQFLEGTAVMHFIKILV